MGRGKRKVDNRGPIQRYEDGRRVAEEQSELDVITPEMRAKGTYQGLRSIVNNHDPVERWKAAGRLSDTQQLAIAHMRRLWELSGLWQRVTASYGNTPSGGSGNAEHRAALEIDARADLHRIKDYIPGVYMEVFENVCRWGHPAGTAGELLSEGSNRAADVRAHLCVCFVADVIAMRERV